MVAIVVIVGFWFASVAPVTLYNALSVNTYKTYAFAVLTAVHNFLTLLKLPIF